MRILCSVVLWLGHGVWLASQAWDGGFMPFSRVVRPAGWSVLLLGCWVCFAVSCAFCLASKRWHRAFGLMQAGLWVSSLLVYMLYHAQHPGSRHIMVFTSWEQVKPYHVQVAEVFFPTMALITLWWAGCVLFDASECRGRGR